ncbi:MAG: histone deacetylase [Verrucomicrobiota bacterium]|nr:histone deacetylase [Verrucomicrobiota bacterium]
MLIFHDPRSVEYARAGHVERPQRIASSVSVLKERHPTWQWRTPAAATEKMLLRAHSEEHLRRIGAAADDFDPDCPAYADTFEHAARAAGAAVDVAHAAMAGERAFSLMRPPGHHATRDRAMGFCYFNHIAIAALDALETGVEQIALWDFDAHHGNGTEAILANHPRIAFASIHQSPLYPGTGLRSFANISNFPVAPMTSRAEHMAVIQRALKTLLAFQPRLLLVSAGFDAYAGDPITQLALEAEDFATCGKWLRDTGLPAGAILEGGYSDALPELINAFLTAWSDEETALS